MDTFKSMFQFAFGFPYTVQDTFTYVAIIAMVIIATQLIILRQIDNKLSNAILLETLLHPTIAGQLKKISIYVRISRLLTIFAILVIFYISKYTVC